MNVLVAPDSFGGSLDSVEAAAAIGRGWRSVRHDDEVVERPMADGGEGTLRAISAALGTAAEVQRCETVDPLGRPIGAKWLLLEDGASAFVELAAASGLALVDPGSRNVRAASTRGTGRVIRAALDAGVSRITIGLGGSASNDGGAGLLVELGARFRDASGSDLPDGGAALARLAEVDLSEIDRRLQAVDVVIATDVTNPLCGPHGASATYGPQKGADAAAVTELAAALGTYAAVLEAATGRAVADVPGAGAAGGTAAGLLAAIGASLRPGAEVVAELVGLPAALARTDLLITGEGRVDAQTLSGKTAARVAALAREEDIPVVLLCGSAGDGAEQLVEAGVSVIVPIIDRPVTLAEAMGETASLLAGAAERVARSVGIGLVLASRGRGRGPAVDGAAARISPAPK